MLANTDQVWKQLGESDPYWAVMTAPQFHKEQLTDAGVANFFASGDLHVQLVLDTIRGQIDPSFQPQSCLDFGCGVGRLAIPFARHCPKVVGVDVSEAMLAEARKNSRRFAVGNVQWVLSDDALSRVVGQYDLVHSFIVLQHIEPGRGLGLIRRLIERVSASGCGVLHVIHSTAVNRRDARLPGWAAALNRGRRTAIHALKNLGASVGWGRQEIAMNPTNLNALFTLLQECGVRRSHLIYTDHGGELGLLIFFRKQSGVGYVI